MSVEIANLIVLADNEPRSPVKEGVTKRVIADSPTLSVVEYFWEKDHETQGDHAHPYDTANYVVSGRFELQLQGQVVVLGPGDGYSVPAGTPRGMRALEEGSYILITARNAEGHQTQTPGS